MEIGELKEHIFKNDKIEFILGQLGCHHIKYRPSKNYWCCCNPDGDNKTAVNITNDKYLNCYNNTRNIGEKADLITLVQFYKKIRLREAVKYIHELLGLRLTYSGKQDTKKQNKQNPLNIFEKVLHRRKKINVLEFEKLSETAFYDFVPHIHVDWFREGIIKRTIVKFKLAYSYKYKRTVVPLRHWNTGELLGFNMRTSVENCEELGIIKYYTTPNYPKSINLFGLWENYDSIIKDGYCTIWESEKAVLKRHSRLDETGVALSGHSISDEQVRILIGLNTSEIIVSMDNDVDIQEIRHICEKFYGIRNVSYIYDKWGLLPPKSNSSDVNNKVYQFLFKHRVKYDYREHNEYLKNLKLKK